MLASWKKSCDQPRQSIKKQRLDFVNKGPSSQSYGFSSSHVWMWELDYKNSWALKNWWLWTVVLEKTLESPLDSKEIQPVHPKGNQFSSVQLLSCVQLFVTPWTAAHQASLPSSAPGVYSDSCPLSWQCHPIVSSSVVPFSSRLQYFPASGAFSTSQFFTSGSQSIRVSASASVLPMNTQD